MQDAVHEIVKRLEKAKTRIEQTHFSAQPLRCLHQSGGARKEKPLQRYMSFRPRCARLFASRTLTRNGADAYRSAHWKGSHTVCPTMQTGSSDTFCNARRATRTCSRNDGNTGVVRAGA